MLSAIAIIILGAEGFCTLYFLKRGGFISFFDDFFDDLEESELSYINSTKDITVYEKLLCQDAQYRILEKRQRQRIKLIMEEMVDEASGLKSLTEAEKQLADLLAKHDRVLVQIAKLESGESMNEEFEIVIGGDSYET